MANTYDFYKPKLDSEYPEVDGPLSITTYINALDSSYSRFREKTAKLHKAAGNGHATGEATDPKAAFSIENVDYPCFHSPYGKLVQKGHARLVSLVVRLDYSRC
jgi:hydroxymethylglutaryl-CoA synthase